MLDNFSFILGYCVAGFVMLDFLLFRDILEVIRNWKS